MKIEIFKKILDLFKQGEVETAIANTEEILQSTSGNKNTAIQLLSRASRLKKDSASGGLSMEEINKQQNQIRAAFTTLLDEVKKSDLEYDILLSYNQSIKKEAENFKDFLNQNSVSLSVEIEAELSASSDQFKNIIVLHKGDNDTFWQSVKVKEILTDKINSSSKIINVVLSRGSESYIPEELRRFDTIYEPINITSKNEFNKLIRFLTSNHVPVYRVNRRSADNPDLPIGYEADVEKIIELLIGESLYSDKNVAVRELIQNSIDAIERRNSNLTDCQPMVRVIVEKNHFEIHDNGEGMNPELLRESFAIIGKSISKEYNIKNIENDKRRKLIGHFGIGFLSTFIISKKIEISTKYLNESQINLSLKKIGEPFEYLKESNLRRNYVDIGTSIKIIFKDQISDSEIVESIKKYCRHISYLTLIHNGKEEKLSKSWNLEESLIVSDYQNSNMFLQICVKKSGGKIIASNNGFFITDNPEAILPNDFPDIISGEINLTPTSIDLTIARDKIMPNAKSESIKIEMETQARNLLIKSAQSTESNLHEVVLPYFQYFLHNIINSQSKKPIDFFGVSKNSKPLETIFGFTKVDLIDILLKTWKFPFRESIFPLSTIIKIMKHENIDTVFFIQRYYMSEDVNYHRSIMNDNLIKEGKLVLDVPINVDVNIKIEGKKRFELLPVLSCIFNNFDIKLKDIDKVSKDDIKEAVVDISVLSDKMNKLINEIENEYGRKFLVGKFGEGKFYFSNINNRIKTEYINCQSKHFKSIEKLIEHEMPEKVKTYMIGLLELDYNK